MNLESLKVREILSHLFGISRWKANEHSFAVQRRFFKEQRNIAILDIGAYVGEVALVYRRFFPRATIYCFEPFPESFTKLRESAKDPMMKFYQTAVSDATGTDKINVNSDPTCNSFFGRPKVGPRYYSGDSENVGEIEVKTVTVDDFCDANNISHIDILKIDVEGAEKKVLRGAGRRLKNCAIDLIYTEVMFVPHYEGGCLFHEISYLLEQYGYTLFDLYNLKRAKDGQLRWGNALFVSPSARARIKAPVSV